jgi:hypothetical protein
MFHRKTKTKTLMFIIDQSLLGRKYTTNDPNTVYTLRGIYVQPNTRPIVMGEIADDPKAINSTSHLVTHQLSEVRLQP